jgi:hypothetical protein
MVDGRDIPQANQLGKVRQLVEVCQRGKVTPTRLRTALGLDQRHLSYYRRAAEVLGFVSRLADGAVQVTLFGGELCKTAQGSEEERAVVGNAVAQATSLSAFLEYLLGSESLTLSALSARITLVSGLGSSTAIRRAQCLERWRAFILGLEQSSITALNELPPRIRNVVDLAVQMLWHGLEHYNAFSCHVRSVVVVQHLDHALELLIKAKLVVSGRPDALDSPEFDLAHCVGALAEMREFQTSRSVLKAPTLSLIHRQRNRTQHGGEAVGDDLLALLVTAGTRIFIAWSALFFGLSVDDLFPRRTGTAMPALDLDLEDVRVRQLERLRAAAAQGLDAKDVADALLLAASGDERLQDGESAAVFEGRETKTEVGAEYDRWLKRAGANWQRRYDSEVLTFLSNVPSLTLLSKTAGKRSGGVPVFFDPKNPAAIPIGTASLAVMAGDVQSILEVARTRWQESGQHSAREHVSVHDMIRLFRLRNSPVLAELTLVETEMLLLSSIRCKFPLWLWLIRLGREQIFPWVKGAIDKSQDLDCIEALSRVLVLATGGAYRRSIEKHRSDRRRKLRASIEKTLTLYDTESKRSAYRTQHVMFLPDEAADQLDGLCDAGRALAGSQPAASVAASLRAQPVDIGRLRTSLTALNRDGLRTVMKVVASTDSDSVVEVLLDQVLASDDLVRHYARRGLRNYDYLHYCPFG